MELLGLLLIAVVGAIGGIVGGLIVVGYFESK
jgi:hypothetical protein